MKYQQEFKMSLDMYLYIVIIVLKLIKNRFPKRLSKYHQVFPAHDNKIGFWNFVTFNTSWLHLHSFGKQSVHVITPRDANT